MITGQKANVRRAPEVRRELQAPRGAAHRLHGHAARRRMWEFYDRLTTWRCPAFATSSGVSPKAFDGRGNYTLGIREQIIFPEVDYDKVEKITGMNVTVVHDREDGRRGARRLLRTSACRSGSSRNPKGGSAMMTDPVADMLTRIRNAGSQAPVTTRVRRRS